MMFKLTPTLAVGLLLIMAVYFLMTTRHADTHSPKKPLPSPGINETFHYPPLIFNVTNGDSIRLTGADLGYSGNEDLQIYNYTYHNPITADADYSRAPFTQAIWRNILNPELRVDQHRVLILNPGYYYLNTSWGKRRIVVVERDATETEFLYRLVYFYASVAAAGRCATGYMEEAARKHLFYSDLLAGCYCTRHAEFFMSVFRPYFKRMRRIDMYGISENSETGEGHSVVEVCADGRWIVVSPMSGAIPFETGSDRPLSFLEYWELHRKGRSEFRYFFEVPALYNSLCGKRYEYISVFPHDVEFITSTARRDEVYSTIHEGAFSNVLFAMKFNMLDLWDGNELFVFNPDDDYPEHADFQDRNPLYMEADKFAQMTADKWNQYTNHYSLVVHNIKGGKPLPERVRCTMLKDCYSDK